MKVFAPAELLEARLRLNPVYRMVAMDALPPAEVQRLGGASGGALVTALLPAAPGLPAKLVCANTTRLLEALRAPAQLPAAMREELGVDADLLSRLVLDSVLEVEQEGRFFTGAAAAEGLPLARVERQGATAPARLSAEALAYAEALDLGDARALSTRLYLYNRVPVSPRWTERLGSPAKLAAWLGLEPGTPSRERLERDWVEAPRSSENPAWRLFRSPGSAHGAPFKLYLNPRPDFCREALEAALPIFAACGVASFKIGRDLMGVLRPDKIVAYAHARAQLEAAAEQLLRALHGVPAQAVPFTAGIDATGLVSWGMDPPISERVARWQGTSWRRWVADRLAIALLAARAAGVGSPAAYATTRLELEGVDVVAWTPARVDWAQGARA